MWYYLVATFLLTGHGQLAHFRPVGPFQEYQACEASRRGDHAGLWVGDECFDAFGSISPHAPAWFGGRP